MVKLFVEDPLNIFTSMPDNRIYCFGAGKLFHEFVVTLKDVDIKGVIDNYKSDDRDHITIEGSKYAVFSFDEYVSRISDKDVLIITSRYYKELIRQMDDCKEFDGISCYVISDIQRDELQDYIDRRNKSEETGTAVKGDGKHYQIWEYIDATNDAGSKAPMDMRTILESIGYETIGVHMDFCGDEDVESDRLWIEKRSGREWQNCVDTVSSGSTLVLQHPFRVPNRFRDKAFLELKKKGVKIISIVHDVEMIRGLNSSDYFEREINLMVNIADAIIVQNDRMKAFFRNRWPFFKRFISLQVFDYLSDHNSDGLSEYSNVIKFAGRLEYRKSLFIYSLGLLNGVRVQLYGPGFEIERYEMNKCPDNIEYCGVYAPEDLPAKLGSGYGLVWDGGSLKTCSEGTGTYLSYNCPHKLSLYLASGLPVIVWEGAATADFVKKNNVGLTINSLYELEDRLKEIDLKQYKLFAGAAREIGKKLKEGYFTKTAVREAEQMIGFS